VQDPLKATPPKEKCPNYKVDEIFRWLCHIWKEAWQLAKNLSIDEQTCKMQGKSEFKTHCGKYKRIGDGIQADYIADDGYTYNLYFRNEPVSQNWLDAGFCPMHAQLLHMFSNLREDGHWCKMDNLFNSVNLARAAYSLSTRVLIHGVIRKSGQGVPPSTIQEELKEKRVEAARGTLKVTVMKGDSKSSNLVIASNYDQKPFYMLSHSTPNVKWVTCTKLIWSLTLMASIIYRFLRWNLSNEYNFEMNDNDVMDQYRLVYWIHRLQRNYKWWWALWLWGMEASIVNAFWTMVSYCQWKGLAAP
jgi:hypothetical protein